MMRTSMVGTTKACVTLSCARRRSHSAGSKLGSITMRRPQYVELRTAEIPAM